MLLVILGAGASYDSAPNLQLGQTTLYRPPLADQLFDNRMSFRPALARYRQCHPIVPYIFNRGKRSLEEVLQELSESKTAERPRQLMAVRYYIRDIIHHCCKDWLAEINCITNHKTLVDQILEYEKERILFVTFNYDELLEDALSDHGFSTNSLQAYANGHYRFSLYKLHGSVNWVRLIWYPAGREKNSRRTDK
jgi:SIR2-like domain